MSALLEKLKKSRQTGVTAGGFSFTITRPTPMEAMVWLKLQNGNALSMEDMQAFFQEHFSLQNESWRQLAQYACEHFVVDWQLTELDIIPGGTGAVLPFDKDVFLLWIQDHPSIVTELGFMVFDAWLKYLEANSDNEKKS